MMLTTVEEKNIRAIAEQVGSGATDIAMAEEFLRTQRRECLAAGNTHYAVDVETLKKRWAEQREINKAAKHRRV